MRLLMLVTLLVFSMTPLFAQSPSGADGSTTDSVRRFLGLPPGSEVKPVETFRVPDSRHEISFTTIDDVIIHGTYGRSAAQPYGGTVILLHGTPGSSREFDDFGYFLLQQGYSVLAIDLRGSGKSVKRVNGETLSEDLYNSKPEIFNEMLYDAEAALDWLAKMRLDQGRIVIAGSRAGANVAGFCAIRNASTVWGAILFSPFKELRAGLNLDRELATIQGRPIMIVNSEKDSNFKAIGDAMLARNPSMLGVLTPLDAQGSKLTDAPDVREVIAKFLDPKVAAPVEKIKAERKRAEREARMRGE